MSDAEIPRPIPAWSQARATYLVMLLVFLVLPFGSCGGAMVHAGIVMRGLENRPPYPGFEPERWTVAESTYRGHTSYTLDVRFSDAAGVVYKGTCPVSGPLLFPADEPVLLHVGETFSGVVACPADALPRARLDGALSLGLGLGALAFAALFTYAFVRFIRLRDVIRNGPLAEGNIIEVETTIHPRTSRALTHKIRYQFPVDGGWTEGHIALSAGAVDKHMPRLPCDGDIALVAYDPHNPKRSYPYQFASKMGRYASLRS